jgi:DNA-binding MarR family transcriptional regulator
MKPDAARGAMIARTVATQCTSFALRRITRLITQRYDEILSPSGLRSTQFPLLGLLHAPQPQSISRLADQMDMDRTTLTRNLRPLMELGFVAVEEGPDARTRTITLTSKGRAAFEVALPLWRKAQKDIADTLGDDGISRLQGAVETALRALSRR